METIHTVVALVDAIMCARSSYHMMYVASIITTSFDFGCCGHEQFVFHPFFVAIVYFRWQVAPTQVNAYYEPLYNQFGKYSVIVNYPLATL